jgi:tRNA-binding protein
MITWNDFEKLDIRTGTITEVVEFEKARKSAYILNIHFGLLGIKKTSAQIKHHYTNQQLLGSQVIAVVNFPPKQIANFISECLVLGIYDEDNNVILLQPERKVSNGLKIG